MKAFISRRDCTAPLLFLTFLFVSALSAFSQSTPANSVWTGQAQCQLTVQSLTNYSYQEMQTWTITGAPTADSPNVYPAMWSVTGQGQSNSTSNAVQLSASWNTNVPPTNAPLTIFVNSANQLIVKSYHAQLRSNSAITGGQTAIVKGVENDTPITGTEYEWQLPQIEVDPTLTDVSGNSSNSITIGIAPRQPSGSTGTANCSWHFIKGTPSSGVTVNPQTTPSASATPLAANISTMAPATLAPVKSNSSIAAQPSSTSIAASASPNVQTTTPQSSTMSCSHANSIPAIPNSPASVAASHAYSDICNGAFSGTQWTPVANLALPAGHYFLIATVDLQNFSTPTLSQQHFTCSIGFTLGQSKNLLASEEGNGPIQTTLMTLTVNGPATSAEVDCAAYPGISASAITNLIAIEVGAMN